MKLEAVRQKFHVDISAENTKMIPVDKLKDKLTIYFPICKQGLEIECGGGYRIKVARLRDQNYYGINSVNESEMWQHHGVIPYCRHMGPSNIGYDDDTFDVVMWREAIPDMPVGRLKKILLEIKRVCSERVYLVFPLTAQKTKKWWIKTLLELGFLPDCIHESRTYQTQKPTLIAELRTWITEA